MFLHKQPTASAIDYEFGTKADLEGMIKDFPTVSAIANYASSYWWGDDEDDYIIYLKNLTTGKMLYSADEPEEEFEDDEWG